MVSIERKKMTNNTGRENNCLNLSGSTMETPYNRKYPYHERWLIMSVIVVFFNPFLVNEQHAGESKNLSSVRI